MRRTTAVCLPLLSSSAFAAEKRKPNDAVRRAFLDAREVPRDVFAIRQRLLQLGGKIDTHILANRGHDNPRLASFTFFETTVPPALPVTVIV